MLAGGAGAAPVDATTENPRVGSSILPLAIDRARQPVRLLLRQPVCDELGDAAGCRWVEVREHGHHVAGGWADLEFAIHPWSRPAVTETADAVNPAIVETKRVAVAPPQIDLARGQHLRMAAIDPRG